MKTESPSIRRPTLTRNILLFALLASASPVSAQTVVSISAPDARAAETWPGQAPDPASIRVTRTGSTTGPLTVWLKVTGTAVRGADYAFGTAAGTTITIPAGSAQLDLAINTIDDAVTELAETIRIDLEEETSAGLPVPYVISSQDRAEVTIVDNDDPSLPPRVVVSVAAVSGGAEGTNDSSIPGMFRITRAANLDVAVTVHLTIGGTARPGDDYVPLPSSVTVPAGQASVEILVQPLDDAQLENPETVTLAIAPSSCSGIFPPPPECYSIGIPPSASVTLADDEIPPPPPVLRLNLAQDTNVFGLPARVNGTFTAVSSIGHIVSYQVRLDGVVKFGGNAAYPEPPASGTPFDFSFAIDTLTGGAHQFQVTAVDDQGLSATATRTLFITAIQPPPPPPAVYTIVALDDEAAEATPGAPANLGRFLFTRAGTPGDLELSFYSFTGTAREGIDYTISYGPWNFSTNGVTNIVSQEITLLPIDDSILEGTETVRMQLCFPIIVMIYGVGAPIGSFCTSDTPGMNATIQLADNDTTPPPHPVVSVTAGDPDAAEVSPLSGEPLNPGAFTISRTAPLTNELIVHYALARSAATANPTLNRIAVNGVDYQPLSGIAVIPLGVASTTVPLHPIYDTWMEGNETATLTLKPATDSPTPYLLDPGTINAATVTIRDFAPTNIPIVSVRATDSQAYEEDIASRTGTLLVTRHGGSVSNDLTLAYAIGGDAANSVDYATLPGSVTIPAGSARASIVITPIADGVTEPVETVSITVPPAPADIFPPPYLLGTALTIYNSAGVSIRDRLLPPDSLSRRQRLVWLRRHRHVIVPLPAANLFAPAVEGGTNSIGTSWAVEASSDLHTWQEIGTTDDLEEFVDVEAGDAPQRFYRFRNTPRVPPE